MDNDKLCQILLRQIFPHHSDFIWTDASSSLRKKPKTYTKYQVMEMRKEFTKTECISKQRRWELARTLQLTERQVKMWFQNERIERKRNLNLQYHATSQAAIDAQYQLAFGEEQQRKSEKNVGGDGYLRMYKHYLASKDKNKDVELKAVEIQGTSKK